MRLRERLPVLWQEPSQVRIGTDPRWSATLADLSPGAVRALTGVAPGASVRTLRAALRREGATQTEADDVVAHLEAAHLLVDAPAPDTPDAHVLGLLEPDGSPAEALGRRSAATVRVHGLGRLGATAAGLLATAGVGRLELDDRSPVDRHDLGWAGLAPGDLGRPRADAVARVLQARGAACVTSGPARAAAPPDAVLLVEHHVADPTRHRALVADAVPHLSVVVREASVLVGPLVEPGATPCLRCLDLHRTDQDPHWPAVAAQLAVARPAPEETALAAVGGSLAAAHVLAWLDRGTSALAGAALEVSLPDAVPRLIGWPTHAECGCAGIPGVPAAGAVREAGAVPNAGAVASAGAVPDAGAVPKLAAALESPSLVPAGTPQGR